MARLLLICVAAALAAAGCGVGEGEEREGGGARLSVTRDFGRVELGEARLGQVAESSTVMRFLRSEFEVKTRFGGRFVSAIDGLEGKSASAQRDWFFFVNGVESSKGAAEFALSPGDRVQWDYRNWEAAMRVPAIVGAFPEPFRSGRDGKRVPVRVECDDAETRACKEVKRRLTAVGAAPSGATLGAPGGDEVIRVVVAPWARAKLVRGTALLEKGPERSGVFARFAGDGRSLELLGQDGRVLRRARSGDGAGIVAATRPKENQLVWTVTGLDGRGVEAAAGALQESVLRNAFAVTATGDKRERLPLEGR